MAKNLVVQPIRKQRVSHHIAVEICRLIREGVLAPGDSLPPERELAMQLSVSRQSLREALRGLEIAGIVETRHGGGTVVRRFSAFGTESPLAMIFEASHDDVSDLWEVRRIVEPALAARAAVRASSEDIGELGRLLESQRSVYVGGGDGDIQRKMDREFHSTIARLTGNQAAEQVIQLLNTLIHSAYRANDDFILDRRNRSFDWHVEIFKAIQAGDPIAAHDLMVEHLQEVEEFILGELIDRSHEDVFMEMNVDSSEAAEYAAKNGGVSAGNTMRN